MTENNAEQPVLTPEEILDAIKAGVRAARDEGLSCAGPDNYVLAGALALLSKLRAPVADERISQLSKEVDEAIREEGAGRPFCVTAGEFKDLLSKMRAALASAPVAITELRIEFTAGGVGYVSIESARAAVLAASKASAPVAGEVVAWMHAEDPARVVSALQKATSERDGGAYASSLRPYTIPLGRLAAPQASEAVRDGKWPMLSELHLHALMFAYNEGYSKAYDGRVFPNPFSENGSQAAAWQLGTDDGTEARAALSAQPGAQKEQSDAN